MPDYFKEDPELWFKFSLSALAAFPSLTVVPILPENPSSSILSFAKYCQTVLSYRSTPEEYADAIRRHPALHRGNSSSLKTLGEERFSTQPTNYLVGRTFLKLSRKTLANQRKIFLC
jgi:hypothetical protein